jgi:hypothetical protein
VPAEVAVQPAGLVRVLVGQGRAHVASSAPVVGARNAASSDRDRMPSFA